VKNVINNVPIWHDILAFSVMDALEKKNKNFDSIFSILGLDFSKCESSIGAARAAIIRAKNISKNKSAKLLSFLNENYKGIVPGWAAVMNQRKLKYISNNGHEIGCHSMNHPILTSCNEDELYEEIREARIVLQQITGQQIKAFCYPNGDYNSNIVSFVRKSGYDYAVTTKRTINENKNALYNLGRIDIISESMRDIEDDQMSHLWLIWRLSKLKSIYEKSGRTKYI
jgi:hypothetical protein